jgi:hypothetical protein
MANNIKTINEAYFLVSRNGDRVFLPSRNINIFPCSRRGQFDTNDSAKFYDPEARLNTERTNRISTAINGFTDSFVANENFIDNDTLVFVLAGYRVEINNFVPSDIAAALGISDGKIYAHLSVHEGISLNTEGYSTEILYRQSTETTQKNYLDVTYTNKDTDGNITDKEDFFVGISFTKEPIEDTLGTVTLPGYDLALFENSSSIWKLVQASLLPRITHGETEDSVKINGTLQTGNTITTPILSVNEITSDNAEIIVAKKLTTKKDIVVAANCEVNTPQLRVDRITSSNTDNTITVDNKKLVVNRSLEMLAKESATDPAKATIEQAIIGDLTVKIDPSLKNSTGKITALNGQITNIDTSTLKVNNYINVGSPASPTDITGNISAKNEITAEARLQVPNTFRAESSDQTTYVQKLSVTDNITAKEVKSDKLTQNGKNVPAIDLVQNGSTYQLQITLDASKK